MEKRILYTSDDGVLCVVIPAPDSGLTIDEIAAKDVPPGKPFVIVDALSLPKSPVFRDAWVLKDGGVYIDLGLAKILSHQLRKSYRTAEFEPLDKILSSQIPGTDVDEIESKRQLIRDKYKIVQDLIDQATSVDKLVEVLNLPPQW